MLKNKLIGASVAIAMLAPMVSMAATAPNLVFSNGQVTVSSQVGTTVSAKFRISVPAGQEVEKARVDVLGDSLPYQCVDVGVLQQGDHDVTVSLPVPPITGSYAVEIQGSGIVGGQVAPDCLGNVVLPATGFGGVILATSNTTTSSTPSGIPADVWAKFTAWMNSLGGTPTPAPSTACSAVAAKSAGLSFGSDTRGQSPNRVGQLQGFLLGEGASIPLLESNKAPYGYFGVQTQTALSFYKANHGCN